MAKRELSSTLKNMKFMQRAALRDEKTKKQEEVKQLDENFPSSGIVRKCVVIMEGDPHPGAVLGRMSFGNFNPSVNKLNEEAANIHRSGASDSNASSSSGQSGRAGFRQNGSSLAGVECSNKVETNCDGEANGDLKRKHSEAGLEQQSQRKSPKTGHGGQHSSPSSSKGSFKPPKTERPDWSVLRPKNQRSQNRG